ncbi:hypothetical protein NQX30_05800 [Candidatus Persebacteraceae bacterium Df01]|jgi:hypothetical protein|uniref:Uncharacterized protein n=1 Tax=Candidatus Doriopsillibacter californiensis TaxID=2970740 RepID=A0ABT7QMD5_9GAMM|nr:hypothetical protein [Candidatus Persebacteraceae bacterium Df01]
MLGGVAGAGGMLIVFPFLFPPPEVNETVSDSILTVISDIRFREDSAGQDSAHLGRGDAAAFAFIK